MLKKFVLRVSSFKMTPQCAIITYQSWAPLSLSLSLSLSSVKLWASSSVSDKTGPHPFKQNRDTLWDSKEHIAYHICASVWLQSYWVWPWSTWPLCTLQQLKHHNIKLKDFKCTYKATSLAHNVICNANTECNTEMVLWWCYYMYFKRPCSCFLQNRPNMSLNSYTYLK